MLLDGAGDGLATPESDISGKHPGPPVSTKGTFATLTREQRRRTDGAGPGLVDGSSFRQF